MNYLLHRQQTPGAVIPVSDELKKLMSEFSREVLRNQPKDVIGFIADYLEAKLIRRENQAVANKTVDNVLDISLDIIELLKECELSSDAAERAVRMIREAFHKHFKIRTADEKLREAFRESEVMKRLVEECGFTEEQAVKAGKIIERAYKTYYLRNVYKDYHGPAVTSDWQDAAKHTLQIYGASGATPEEMERAAVRIQAAYRGYYTKKQQELNRKAEVIQKAIRSHQVKQVATGVLEQLIDDVVDPKISGREEVMRIVDMVLNDSACSTSSEKKVFDEAATKIQSVFRGKQARKEVFKKVENDKIEREIRKVSLVAQASNITDDNLEKAATLVQSAARGHLTRQKIQKEKAAIQMQSLVRGHLVRKRLAEKSPPAENK
ncbi:abnormal spindle-like microcephaly-associated protein homolog [Wyeomyia smithii]|uniref:abnormal spindle-like microcephaly-associated protein homolog n=1 Tax=Wyeomyia smithii TaxID=174621 RepID=UPI002467D858|nr:abnormal spindle-like microcephaly-associated protein homolog [Wyeomyia smithii]